MGIKLPEHYVIMQQFIHQVGRALGDEGRMSYRGPRMLSQALRDAGWVRADHHRPTLDRDGNDVTVVRTNQDSVWVRPEHWDPDPELRPPVSPKTPQAEEFLRSITRGSRIGYPVPVKEEIMDELVSFMSGGKVSHWFGHAKGPERAALVGRLDRGTDATLPSDVEQQVLVPQAVLMNAVRKASPDPSGLQAAISRAEKGLARLGFQQAMAHDRARAVWYHTHHWEPAIGGQLGLLPLTPQAEEYERKLPETPTSSVQRYLPDASYMTDIEKIVAAAAAAKAKSPSPEDVAAMRNRPSVAAQQAGFAKGDLGAIERGDRERRAGLAKDKGLGLQAQSQGSTAHRATGQGVGRGKAQGAAPRPAPGPLFADDEEETPIPVAAPVGKRPSRPEGNAKWRALDDDDDDDDEDWDEDDDE